MELNSEMLKKNNYGTGAYNQYECPLDHSELSTQDCYSGKIGITKSLDKESHVVLLQNRTKGGV